MPQRPTVNPTTQRVPIIAVFGSDGTKAPELAEAIGREIAKRGFILLTGGAGPAGKAVKNKALAGADQAAKDGYLAPWIGIPKARDGGPQPGLDPNRTHTSLIQVLAMSATTLRRFCATLRSQLPAATAQRPRQPYLLLSGVL
jgi:predicted Rossmann-fold nucleotide-binding protein